MQSKWFINKTINYHFCHVCSLLNPSSVEPCMNPVPTVAGGAVTIGLDLDAVDEYTRLNPDLETVDEFLTMLISSDFIPEDITRHCKIQANLLSTGSLHLVFESVNQSQSICKTYSESLADQINNRTANSTTTTVYPQVGSTIALILYKTQLSLITAH